MPIRKKAGMSVSSKKMKNQITSRVRNTPYMPVCRSRNST